VKKRLIVIGGGAAGFFCAVNAAANAQLDVTILEKSSKLLSKVKVSGGGRCNVTHNCNSIAEMVKKYPRGEKFLKKTFHHFFTSDTITWFQKRDVQLKTESDGRMFPASDSSQTIIDCLLKEAGQAGVHVITNVDIAGIEKKAERFVLQSRSGKTFQSDYLCIACGGFSKTDQYKWIIDMSGHSIEPPVPSLFTFNLVEKAITQLMGISVEPAQVKINKTKFEETGPLLITHWGLSGPAVLKLSAFAARYLHGQNYDFQIAVNWIPQYNEVSCLEFLRSFRNKFSSRKIVNTNPFNLPQRLWEYHMKECGISQDTRWADLIARSQNLLAKQLCTNVYRVKGKTTFKEEFVTAGGIRLSEIDPRKMESILVPHLYFAGEIMNVDGITGGFNFQHAWTSGWIAAKAINSNF